MDANFIKIQTRCRPDGETTLEVSDWVTFLSSEKYGALSNVMGSFALAAALFAILYSATSKNTAADNWGVIIGAGVIILMMWIAILILGRRAKQADKILSRIMLGELANPVDIRNAWIRQQR